MKILCFLGFHKKKHIRDVIFKDELVETVNTTVYCERCGLILKEYGTTHVGPVTVMYPDKTADI